MLRRLRADRPSARLVAFLICAAGALLLAHGHVKTDTFYSATYRERTVAGELPKPNRRVYASRKPPPSTATREKGIDAQIEEVEARLADLLADHESEKIILKRWLLDHARRGPGDEVQSAPSFTSRETPARADQPDPYHEPMKPSARPGETYHGINALRGTGTKNSLEHHPDEGDFVTKVAVNSKLPGLRELATWRWGPWAWDHKRIEIETYVPGYSP
jgi:hypothetical protein